MLCFTPVTCQLSSGDEWHLRQTNWCREAADILDDLAVTLEQCHLRDGDHLLLESGKLPPKVTVFRM